MCVSKFTLSLEAEWVWMSLLMTVKSPGPLSPQSVTSAQTHLSAPQCNLTGVKSYHTAVSQTWPTALFRSKSELSPVLLCWTLSIWIKAPRYPFCSHLVILFFFYRCVAQAVCFCTYESKLSRYSLTVDQTKTSSCCYICMCANICAYVCVCTACVEFLVPRPGI